MDIIYKTNDVSFPAGHLPSEAIKIYDPLQDVTEEEVKAIIQYLYDEGFIQDRRISVQVIKGSDGS